MKVKVRRMRKDGVLVPSPDDPKSASYAGLFSVEETRDHVSGRALLRARLTKVAPDLTTDVLPELMDARLLLVKGSKLRMHGFERIGAAEYAQTWSIEVVPC
jgi:hypothetical protein